LELTQLGEGTEDTRRQVPKRELVTSHQSESQLDEVIEVLAKERLIVTSELVRRSSAPERIEVVDVAHEALIRYWPQLRQWIEDNRMALKQKRSLEDAAEAWLEKGKQQEQAYLLQGPKLAEAEAFLRSAAEDTPLSQLAQEFIQVSQSERDHLQRAEEARQQRELEALRKLLDEEEKARQAEQRARKEAQRKMMAAIVGAILVTIAAGFAWTKRNQAIQEQIITLTASSTSQLTNNNQLEALMLAIQAGRQLQQQPSWFSQISHRLTILTATTLQQADYETQEQNRLERHQGWVNSVSFSPDGETLASGSDDGTILLWHKDGRYQSTLQHGAQVRQVAFSQDGKQIAAAGEDGTIKLWQLGNSQAITLSKYSDVVTSIAFNPTGQLLAVGSRDRTVRLWQLDQRSPRAIAIGRHND